MYSRAVLLEHLQLSALRFVAGVGAAFSALWIRHALLGSGSVPWNSYAFPSIIAGALVVVAMWGRRASGNATVPHRVLVSLSGVAIATGVLLALSFFYRGVSYSRATVVVFIPIAGLALFFVESAHIAILKRIRANEDATLRVLIIGYGDLGQRIAISLTDDPAYLRVIGCLHEDRVGFASDSPVRYLGTPDAIDDVLAAKRIDLAIICLESATTEVVQDLVGRCMAANVRWSIIPSMMGLSPDRVHIDRIGSLPVISERGSRLFGHDWLIKRSLDVLVSGVALIILSPFMALAALAIRLTSQGSAIYRQERVGLNGRPFTLFKFRTMWLGADTSVHRDRAALWIHGRTGGQSAHSGVHKLSGDDRITRLGAVLRATSFDEVPQLWNVLRGDMSLVGPRPPIPYEVEQYTEWHRRRLAVPPGITGLWQVAGRSSLSFEEMIGLDLDYIEQWTLLLDLNILIRTVPALVLHRGR